jgi:ABC-type branched-subunit amino acid transport system substrate-binding protein
MSATGAMALAGCSGNGGDGSGRTINQGFLLPLTGDLGALGTAMRDAGIMATQQVNDADIDLTVDKQEEDTRTTVPEAISGANALVNAGYPMMVGGATSNIEIGNQVFVPNEMVACSPSNTLPTLRTFEDDGLFFRTTPGDRYQGFAMAQAAAERLDGIETAATTYINDDYGQLLSQWFTDHFEQGFGGSVQEQVVHDPVQSSYSSKLQTALQGDPDLFVAITYPQTGTQLFSDYYADFDTDRPIMLADGTKSPTLPDEVGRSMNNAIGTFPAADGPAFDNFVSMYEEEYGNAAAAFTAQSYDASAITILANAAAGENDGPTIAEEISNVANPSGTEVTIDNLAEGVETAANGEEIQYSGASSAVDFDDQGDLTAGSYEIWEFDDSESGINRLDIVDVGQNQALNPRS